MTGKDEDETPLPAALPVDEEPRQEMLVVASEVPASEEPADLPMAMNLGSVAGVEVRRGSPFATSVVPSPYNYRTADEGVRRESAKGGVLAAGALLFFAVPCMFWFTPGVLLIAPLGILLALYGATSRQPTLSLGIGLLHTLLVLVGVMWQR